MEVWILLMLLLAGATAKRHNDGRRTDYACQGQDLMIDCGTGRVIYLLRANYGRYSISICNEHGSLDWSVDCTSHLSYYVIYERCNHMSKCLLHATSADFADPCPGTLKYLEVQYECVPEETLTRRVYTASSTTTTTTTTSAPRTPLIIPITRSTKPTVRTTPYTSKPAINTTDVILKTSPVISSTSLPSTTSVPVVIPSTTTKINIIRTTDAVFKKGAYCPQIQSRNITWSWTKPGTTSVQKCPGGTSGNAMWYCGMNPVQWVPDTPDLSECSSLWVDNLKSRVDGGDSVVNIATELSVMTHRKPLYGGDVRHATEILHRLVEKMASKMKEIADDKQRHQLLQELLDCTGDVISNLFNVSASWKELASSEQRYLASSLIEALEKSSWLLASAHKSAFYFRKALNNIFLSVRILEAWTVSQVTFPSTDEVQGTPWQEIQASIYVPVQAVLSTATNGVVKIIFASYNQVGDFLGTAAFDHEDLLHNSSRIINSQIISASTGALNGAKFIEPVVVKFKLIKEENVTNPQCVFWDSGPKLWSQDGCWLKAFNTTHAICECDHLTSFALLMDIKNGSKPVIEDTSLPKVVIYSSCALVMLLLIITVFLIQIFRIYSNDYSSVHQHFCISLLVAEIICVASLGQIDIVCKILSGLLHFSLQAVFVWLFLLAFQLYLMLRKSSHCSRILYYYIPAYGIPLVIVIIAAFVDPKSYGTVDYCFLRFDNYYIFSFVGPAIFCLLGAVIFYVLNNLKICWSSFKNKEKAKINFIKMHNHIAIAVVFISSISWTFLLLYMGKNTPAMAYSFSTWNILQGLTVFICFGLCNDEVQQAYRKWKEGPYTQPKTTTNQFPLSNTSSLHMEPPFLQPSTAMSSLSTVTSPEIEFQLGNFHCADLCHNTRSPIYDNREQLSS